MEFLDVVARYHDIDRYASVSVRKGDDVATTVFRHRSTNTTKHRTRLYHGTTVAREGGWHEDDTAAVRTCITSEMRQHVITMVNVTGRSREHEAKTLKGGNDCFHG